jgi:excisionase family DNA binding protein
MPDQLPDRSGPGEDPWLTVQQVSEELKIHPATVRVWIKDGRLRAVRVGREWRVRRSEVDRALLLDASPAYLRQEADSAREHETVPTAPPAPRQIADHIMTVTPLPGAES